MTNYRNIKRPGTKWTEKEYAQREKKIVVYTHTYTYIMYVHVHYIQYTCIIYTRTHNTYRYIYVRTIVVSDPVCGIQWYLACTERTIIFSGSDPRPKFRSFHRPEAAFVLRSNAYIQYKMIILYVFMRRALYVYTNV